jgi:DNA-binding transcriptional MocR family regulator
MALSVAPGVSTTFCAALIAASAPSSAMRSCFTTAGIARASLWLTLPATWNRAEFASHIQRQGLAVVTSDSFDVDSAPEHAIRVAVGAARNRADLAAALDLLTVALMSPTSASRIV